MKKISFSVLLIAACVSSNAQQVIDLSKTDFSAAAPASLDVVKGQVYSPAKFVKVTSGTPFFKDEWMKGGVIDNEGNIYGNVWLKLNLIDNEVNYQAANGQEMVATNPLKYIILNDSVTNEKYEFIKGDQLKNSDKSLADT